MNRRSFNIEITSFRIRADESVKIARLEFIRVLGQRFQIADAIMAGAGLEGVAERQRAEGRISSGASPSNGESVAIDCSGFHKIPGAIDAIIYIDNSPLTFKSFSVLSAIARTSAIVDIENSDASTRPVLNRVPQRRGSSRSWPAMTHD